jgi:hypothetical protein
MLSLKIFIYYYSKSLTCFKLFASCTIFQYVSGLCREILHVEKNPEFFEPSSILQSKKFIDEF